MVLIQIKKNPACRLRFLTTLIKTLSFLGLVLAGHPVLGQVPDGTYKIVNRQSGQVLQAEGTVDVSPITQYPYNGADNKQWILNSLGNGQYTLQGVKSGLYATVASSSTAENAWIQLFHWQNQNNFKVTLTPTDSGYYRINFVNSGKAMAVSGGSLNYLAQVVQVTYTGQWSAQWKFVAPGNVSNAGTPFSMIVLPDTQEYCSGQDGATAAMFHGQTTWINNERASRNIKYVMHVGDLVDHQFQPEPGGEWSTADAAMDRLNDTVPYGVVPGNHDWWDVNDGSIVTGSNGTWTNWNDQNYNRYFGVSRFSGKSYYGGAFGMGNNNHYDLITANGMDFVIIYIEWHLVDTANNINRLDPADFTWANGILQQYPDRKGILVSHELIDTGGNFKANGTAVYNALKGNKNLFLMWCGHFSGESSRVDYNPATGTSVYTLMSDYQDDLNGGNGKLKVMTFDPAQDLIKIETYSPTTSAWYKNVKAELTVPLQMGPVDGAVYELEPLCAPGRRMEVAAWGNTNGANVQIWQDRNQTSQRWQIQNQTDGSYELIPQNAVGLRLEVAGGSTAAGANVQIWTDANVNQQRWILESQTDGNYELIPKHALNRRVDVDGAINADGTNVKVWSDSNGPAQRWRLIKQ